VAARIRAPEFPDGLSWLGSRPLRLQELRGQVVILDFWAYCCVNCMHVMDVLSDLEARRRGQPVLVIGVHSAKFDAERDPQRIRDAMARHGVRHPVIVDADREVWSRYAIRAWPTLVVIRPDGTIATAAPGEAELSALDAFVQGVLAEAHADGTLADRPFELGPEHVAPRSEALLSFPGKIVALAGDRLAVSDSGHHRVLVIAGDGGIERIVGSGQPGLRDAALDAACFRNPQGLAADAGRLFVADTGNHALREVDLAAGSVRTLAGTGELGRGSARGTAPALDLALRSPWDVALAGDYVLIAMAGAHQIWAFHRERETLSVLAGTGREALGDGSLAEASFAQPSGLALDEHRLYVADAEASAVRVVDLLRGEVFTLVGTGLFDFGDRDGDAPMLQHPVGISYGPAGLLVADTFNNKIKRVDARSGLVRTLALGDFMLAEPGGLCQRADGRVVIADTNHHRLVELAPGAATARVLELRPAAARAAAAVVELEPATVGLGAISLRLEPQPADGYELATGSRLSLRLTASGPLAAPGRDVGFEVGPGQRHSEIVLRAGPAAGEAGLEIRIEAVVCGGPEQACRPIRARYRLPLVVAGDRAHGAVARALKLPSPE